MPDETVRVSAREEENRPLLEPQPETALSRLTAWLIQNEELAFSVLIPAMGDLFWTAFSYDKLNYALNRTDNDDFDLQGQWAGQELYVTLAMTAASIATKAGYAYAGRPFPAASAAAFVMAASTAVYTWDRAQDLGMRLGQEQLGLSANASGYFSSIFAGLGDGPTQMLMITLINLLTKDAEWSRFKNDPSTYLKTTSKEFGLSMTIGAIPGTLWQIIFNASVIANLGPVATAILVAIVVAAANVACAKVSTRIMQSARCQNLCGRPEETENDAAHHQAPCNTIWNSVSAFFGQGNGDATAAATPNNDAENLQQPPVAAML